MSDWTIKQKIAFIKIQNICAELGLTNQEVADMFLSFENRNDVATHFLFVTSRWRINELEKQLED